MRILPASHVLRMRAFSTGASQRGLAPISSNRVGGFDAGNGRVEQIGLARAVCNFAPSWRHSRLATPKRAHQILQRLDFLRRRQIADDGGHLVRLRRVHARGDRGERFGPARGLRVCRSCGHRAGRAAACAARHRRGAPCRKSIPRSRLRSGAAARASLRARAYRRGCCSLAHPSRRWIRSCAIPRAAH